MIKVMGIWAVPVTFRVSAFENESMSSSSAVISSVQNVF